MLVAWPLSKTYRVDFSALAYLMLYWKKLGIFAGRILAK